MQNIRKFWFYLKKAGFKQTMILFFSYLKGKIRSVKYKLAVKLFWKKKCAALEKAVDGKTVMVFTPSVEWNFLFQRAQQIARCFAKRENIAVVYLTTQWHYDNFSVVSEIEPNLYLMNCFAADKLDVILSKAKEVVSCVYNISYAYMLDFYKSDKLEYEYVDDLSVTVSKAESLAEKQKIHDKLLSNSDLVVATATKLIQEIENSCKKSVLLPNAVDYNFFSQKAQPFDEINNLHQKYDCVILYYGALASWFDYELVKQTAIKKPNWVWVLIGKKIGNDMEQSRVEALENVITYASVPYEKLPSYIAGADMLTIPFVLNEITAATSPVKLFEYMAAAKPIITSDMNECRRYKSVNIYKNADDFVSTAQRLLDIKDDNEYFDILKKEASENTWDSRAEQILQGLNII